MAATFGKKVILISLLCLGACLLLSGLHSAPALADDELKGNFPPPPTPGWAYGPVTYSVKFETWPQPYYKVTMYIKSPANIWFRYMYTNGPGKRAYHVSSGHSTKLYHGCIGVQAFGVNLSDFGPMSSKSVQWREKVEDQKPVSESPESSEGN